MATPSQIAANRRNALKSTGPRSAAGKAVSCFNALKHGIDARSQCIPGENRASLDQLAAEYHERFAPSTPEQRCLVDTLVSCEWELRRYRATGAQLWQMAARRRVNPDDALPLAEGFNFCQTTFMRLQRAIDSAHRNYHRALKTLQSLPCQEVDPAAEPSEPAAPGCPLGPPSAANWLPSVNPPLPKPAPKARTFPDPLTPTPHPLSIGPRPARNWLRSANPRTFPHPPSPKQRSVFSAGHRPE